MKAGLLRLADRMLDRVVPKTHAAAAYCWTTSCCTCDYYGCWQGTKTCCANGSYQCFSCNRNGPRC